MTYNCRSCGAIFLELLDQPVKGPTLRPFNMEKRKGLLHITFKLPMDQSTFVCLFAAACLLMRLGCWLITPLSSLGSLARPTS
jgi:hypothetical protein